MPGGAGLIIANGAELIAPITIGNIPKVAGITPPTLNNSIMLQGLDGAVNYIQVGTAAAATGASETFRTKSGIISEGASADTVVIGKGAAAAGSTGRSVAIGTGAAAGTGNESVVIGYNAGNGNNSSCIVIGSGANVSQSGAIAIGAPANAWGGAGNCLAIAIGHNSFARPNSAGVSLAIGMSAYAYDGDTVIGNSATSNISSPFGNQSVVVGAFATSNKAQGNNTALGYNAVTSGVKTVSVGHTSAVSQDYGIAIGQAAVVNQTNSIVIGAGVTTWTSNLCVIGGPNNDISLLVIGKGNTAASPVARTIRFTNASGADNAAGSVTLYAPLSTGAATEAGFAIAVGTAGASSSTLQTPTTRLNFTPGGVAWYESDAPAGAAATFQSGSRARQIMYGYNGNGNAISFRQVAVAHAPGYVAYRCGGTPAAPTALASGDTMMNVGAGGYDGTSWSVLTQGLVRFAATEAWTSTAKGTKIELQVTKNGTTTQTAALTVENDGSTTINPIAASTIAMSFGANALRSAGGAGAGTLNNLPAAVVAGNPAVYLVMNVNGVPTYFPGWQ